MTDVYGDYANIADSFEFFQIGSRTAFPYRATFARAGRPMAEFFTRVIGEKTMVMLFAQLPADAFAPLRPELDAMMATVRLP